MRVVKGEAAELTVNIILILYGRAWLYLLDTSK